MTMLVPSLTLNLFLLIVALPLGSAFDRDSCFQTTQDLLGNQSLSPTSPFFFRDTFDSPPYNGVNNMTLTLDVLRRALRSRADMVHRHRSAPDHLVGSNPSAPG
jgi:hypothetical protein